MKKVHIRKPTLFIYSHGRTGQGWTDDKSSDYLPLLIRHIFCTSNRESSSFNRVFQICV